MAYLDEEDLNGYARAWKDTLKAGNFYTTKEIAKMFAELHNEEIKEIQLINVMGLIQTTTPTGRKNTEWQ
jgi:hypothetical protein